MDSCRHRGRSQFSEKSLGLLATTSKIPITIPAESHSATNPIENNALSGTYAQELAVKRRQVRCV